MYQGQQAVINNNDAIKNGYRHALQELEQAKYDKTLWGWSALGTVTGAS